MSTYEKIWWLPIAGGLSGVGLVLSYLAMRSRGMRSGLRGAAWSLLPIAAYLTGSIQMFWKMGVAIGDFAKGFAFSPKVWSGIAVAGLSLVLFVATGGIRRRRLSKQKQPEQTTGSRSAGSLTAAGALATTSPLTPATTAPLPARTASAKTAPATKAPATELTPKASAKGKRKAGAAGGGGDDLTDVEDILRRHGIS